MRRLLPALLLLSWLGVSIAPTTLANVRAPNDDSGRVLSQAADATLAVQTMHFSISNRHGDTTIFPAVRLRAVDGDIEQPGNFKATLVVRALFADLQIHVIGIGDRFWLANPLQGGGEYQERSIDPDIVAIARPDVVVRMIAQLMIDPEISGSELLDDVETTIIAGFLDLPRLDEVAPSFPIDAINTDAALPIQLWIDDQSLIRMIQIAGRFVRYDDENVIREIVFSAFNEPVEILPPS